MHTNLLPFLSLLGITAAMQLRIGVKTFAGDSRVKPYFKVFNDSWETLGSKVGSPSAKLPSTDKFCTGNEQSTSYWYCPYQETAGGYGFRVTKNGGGDHYIYVEQWKGSQGSAAWCGRPSGVWEDGNQIIWQCDFRGY